MTPEALNQWISNHFHMDRDRGYTFAYSLLGCSANVQVQDTDAIQALASLMHDASVEHGLALECSASISDTLILGVRLYGGDTYLQHRKTFEKLLKKDFFPMITATKLSIEKIANNSAKWTTLTYGANMAPDDAYELLDSLDACPKGLAYFEVDEDRDAYGEGTLGFEIKTHQLPSKKQLTGWQDTLTSLNISSSHFRDIY